MQQCNTKMEEGGISSTSCGSDALHYTPYNTDNTDVYVVCSVASLLTREWPAADIAAAIFCCMPRARPGMEGADCGGGIAIGAGVVGG